jgi:Reverse transcriptase (RNA-dependent DNA polymerase)
MILLDLQKAFDAVWHDALLHKILLQGFPMYLTKIISSFLQNRISFVSLKNGSSERFAITAGVPQGSSISPFLFNLYVNDISIPNKCEIAQFADDSALFSSIENYKLPELVERIELGMAELERYFSSWKMSLNAAKTESILFTHSRIMLEKMKSEKVKFSNTVLEWQPVVKYLGVILDSKLLMRQNIEQNIEKARKASCVLYPLLKRNSPVPTNSKITLYRSYIRPILTYACPVFSNAAKSHIEKLQVVQNKNLRMVLNVPYRTRISYLHTRANIPTVKNYITKLTEGFYKQSAKSKNNLVKRLGEYSTRLPSSRLKHKLPRSSF